MDVQLLSLGPSFHDGFQSSVEVSVSVPAGAGGADHLRLEAADDPDVDGFRPRLCDIQGREGEGRRGVEYI